MDRTSEGFRAKLEACLSHYQRFGSYLNIYHEAFKILMKDAEASSLHVDRIAYPMLFIARHCLELGFKTNIRHFRKYSEKNDSTSLNSHNLKALFQAFVLHVRTTIKNLKAKHGIEVEATEVEAFERYCSELEKLTLYLDQLDRLSISFRYPVDKDNNRVFQNDERVNLLDIDELLSQGMVLLNHTADVFGNYTDYVDDIEELYKDEIRSI